MVFDDDNNTFNKQLEYLICYLSVSGQGLLDRRMEEMSHIAISKWRLDGTLMVIHTYTKTSYVSHQA